MASAFTHAAAALAVGAGLFSIKSQRKLIVLGMICAAWPDIDALGYFAGIPYQSPWGHRGFTHSLLFAAVWGGLLAFVFFRDQRLRRQIIAGLFLFICTASHPFLDAMTDAGKGVAFFWPWDSTRYFFPFRPITASPISVTRFFTERGWIVIKNELVWVWLPSLALFCLLKLFRRLCRGQTQGTNI